IQLRGAVSVERGEDRQAFGVGARGPQGTRRGPLLNPPRSTPPLGLGRDRLLPGPFRTPLLPFALVERLGEVGGDRAERLRLRPARAEELDRDGGDGPGPRDAV